jgi:hypothetical protein
MQLFSVTVPPELARNIFNDSVDVAAIGRVPGLVRPMLKHDPTGYCCIQFIIDVNCKNQNELLSVCVDRVNSLNQGGYFKINNGIPQRQKY